MSSLSTFYIKTEILKKLAKHAHDKNLKGVELTLSISDKPNNYGQNVSAYLSQTKEERDNKEKRAYVGNGKVFWTDGKITKIDKKKSVDSQPDDLPF